MAKVYDSILDLVGKTPLVELKRIEEKEGLQAKLIAKVESFNPAGSVKDRIAKAMIEDAEGIRRRGCSDGWNKRNEGRYRESR